MRIGCSTTVAAQIEKRAGRTPTRTSSSLRQQVMGVAMRPGQAELLKKASTTSSTRNKANGELNKLYQKWLGTELPAMQASCRQGHQAMTQSRPRGAEPIIRIEGLEQVVRALPGADRHRPVGARRRAHRHLRPVGLGQVDADPLHQPARDGAEGPASSSTASTSRAGGKNVDAVRREVGMVFQQFNLFPHLTVAAELHPGADALARHEQGARPKRRR